MDVLLIEDDVNVALVTSELLRAHGYGVSLAASVSEALGALVPPHRFQAILLDLRLGEERGEVIIEQLGQLKRRYPPVIILSAQPVAELAETAKSIGAARWLSKPASMADITRALEEVRKGTPE